MQHSSRRSFLLSTVGAAAAAGTTRLRASVVGEPHAALKVMPYGTVELLDSPLKRQFDENHAFFLNLSEDRLLKIYRKRSGLPAPGEDMGGWYEGFCPGAHFGQYLSALARFAAVTGNEATRAKVNRLVSGYGKTVDPSGKFFVDLRYPGYTYDKLVLGLIDSYSLVGDRNAVGVLEATTTAAIPHMAERALTPEEREARPHKDDSYTWDETYTMAENLFLAWERTGNRRYFEMAKPYLYDKPYFDPLSRGEDVLPGRHAYSHVNALSSGMQGYLKLGDPKYLHAVLNAVEMIWKDQSFATGGWGPNEGFVEPGKGELGKSLAETRRSFETPCGAYAHFKVMRYLLTLTKDPRYGDSLERVTYNTVLGAKPIQQDGSCFYYSDYHPSGVKAGLRVVSDSPWPWDHDGRWACCSGTLPQAAADYNINAYFQSADGMYVNLFVPSRVRWTAGGSKCALTQQTDYPTGNLTTLTMELTAPSEFALYLRVPAWAGPHTSVSINSKRASEPVRAGSFHRLQRAWKNGDRVEFEIDQRVRTEAVDGQTPNMVAILRGPQVLFGITEQPVELTRSKLDSISLRKGTGADWAFDAAGRQVTMRPFWAIRDEVYQTYWRVREA